MRVKFSLSTLSPDDAGTAELRWLADTFPAGMDVPQGSDPDPVVVEALSEFSHLDEWCLHMADKVLTPGGMGALMRIVVPAWGEYLGVLKSAKAARQDAFAKAKSAYDLGVEKFSAHYADKIESSMSSGLDLDDSVSLADDWFDAVSEPDRLVRMEAETEARVTYRRVVGPASKKYRKALATAMWVVFSSPANIKPEFR